MKCDRCKKNEANIHILNQTPEGEKSLHLCIPCAISTPDIELPDFALNDMLEKVSEAGQTKLVQLLENAIRKKEKEDGKLVCRYCKTKESTLRREKRVGCAKCYSEFAEIIGEWLPRLDAGGHHDSEDVDNEIGDKQEDSRKKHLQNLQQKLVLAVTQEEYEKAIELRDLIQEIHKKNSGNRRR